FTTSPASTSTWVTGYSPVQVMNSPGARAVTGQVMSGINGSPTAMPLSVRLPVWVPGKVSGSTSPTAPSATRPATSATWMPGACPIVTRSVSPSWTGPPLGSALLTIAWFTTSPASTSACVTGYSPVQVIDAPGASVVAGQVTSGIRSSLTLMPLRV